MRGDRMEKTCENCVYFDRSATEEPCNSCDGPDCRFKPKETGMGEKTFTMTFTTDKINEEALQDITGNTTKIDTEAELKAQAARLRELEEKANEQERLIRELERMNTQKEGEIRGLKFAIRCNGVSGGEV